MTDMQSVELIPRKEPDSATLMTIQRMIEDPDLKVERLHELLDFHERIERKEAEKAFYRDFAQAAIAMPRVTKHGLIDMKEKGKIAFARYEDIDRVLRPLESQYGFSRMFLTQPSKEGVTMVMVLAHTSGHCVKSERFMPPDTGAGRNGMQAIGSASSYAKRYLTLDIWNIITEGEDNDATSSDPITRDQVDQIYTMLDALQIKRPSPHMDRFLKFVGAQTVELIQRSAYDAAMARLRGMIEYKRSKESEQ